MENRIMAARERAEAGELREAIEILAAALQDESQLEHVARAEIFELQGRCEMGLLANVQAASCFEEAEQYYEHCGMRAEAAYCRLMRVRKMLDDRLMREARNVLSSSLRLALGRGWNEVLALGLEFLGLLCFHNKELRKASGLLREAMSRGDSRKLSWEQHLTRLSLANCCAALGDREAADAIMQEVVSDPRHLKIPRISAYLLMNSGFEAYVKGDLERARASFEEMVSLAAPELRSPRGLSWLSVMASYNLGLLEVEEGHYEAARQRLEEAAAMARESGYNPLLCGSLTSLSMIELLLNNPQGALSRATQCEEYVEQFGDIETRLADYFLAPAYLANGLTDQAQVLWLYRPELEDNAETRMQYGWIRRMLRHLLKYGAAEPFSLGNLALQLVQKWLDELPIDKAEVKPAISSGG